MGNEEGMLSVPIPQSSGASDEFLDVYYLGIYPSLLDAPGPQAFPLIPVTAQPNGLSDLLLIGHRGMGAEISTVAKCQRWPENSLLSFRKAAELGLKMVEFDVIPTKSCEDLVLYHNFSVGFKAAESEKGPENSEIDVFHNEGDINFKTPNLISNMGMHAIKQIQSNQQKWGANNCNMNNTQNIGDSLTLTSARSSLDAQYLPLLSDVLCRIPLSLAFDHEIKYPVETPLTWFRLKYELDYDMNSRLEIGQPFLFYAEINKCVDAILQCIWKHGSGRKMILSSFNPDVCVALRLKQRLLPVLYISRGGLHPSGQSSRPHSHDPRHLDAFSAIEWAHIMQLDGVVLPSSVFSQDPMVQVSYGSASSAIAADQSTRLADVLAKYNLACMTFGPGSSTHEYAAYATTIGLTGVFIDQVEDYMNC